jgi:phage-related holin
MLETFLNTFNDWRQFWLWKTLGGFLITLFGQWTDAYTAFSVLFVMDTIAGAANAMKTRTFNTSLGLRKFVIKLGWYGIGVIVANEMDHVASSTGMTFLQDRLLPITIYYACATEALSVLRNATAITGKKFNLPWVRALQDVLEEQKDNQKPANTSMGSDSQ